MKKTFIAILACLMAILTLTLTACGDRTDRYGFYAQSTLNKNLIPDLPKIRSDGETSLKEGQFTFTTTREEFDEYLQSVYDYLVNCPFEYFGYPTEVLSTFFGGAPKCAFEYGNELSDFQTDIAFSQSGSDLYEQAKTGTHYFFVWGNEGVNEGSNGRLQIVNARYLQIGCYPREDYVRGYMQLKYALMDYTFYLLAD